LRRRRREALAPYDGLGAQVRRKRVGSGACAGVPPGRILGSLMPVRLRCRRLGDVSPSLSAIWRVRDARTTGGPCTAGGILDVWALEPRVVPTAVDKVSVKDKQEILDRLDNIFLESARKMVVPPAPPPSRRVGQGGVRPVVAEGLRESFQQVGPAPRR
jgi:hypothetical protein